MLILVIPKVLLFRYIIEGLITFPGTICEVIGMDFILCVSAWLIKGTLLVTSDRGEGEGESLSELLDGGEGGKDKQDAGPLLCAVS